MNLDNDILQQISVLLHEADGGAPVFLYSEQLQANGRQAAWLQLRQALGGRIEVGGVRPVAADEALATVRNCLSGSYEARPPILGRDQWQQFDGLLQQVLDQWQQALEEAVLIEQFWLSEGHPVSTGAWDFAFLLSARREALVFMGAAVGGA